MRRSLQDNFNQTSLESLTVSQESLLGEMLQSLTNIFYYRPFNDTSMAKAAVDPVRERIRSIYRLERLLKMCYADPRWLAKKDIRTDSIGGQGIVNLLSYGSRFDQDNPLQFIEREVYNINNFRVNWAKATVLHSDYARSSSEEMFKELRKYCQPMIDAQKRANERAASQMQNQLNREQQRQREQAARDELEQAIRNGMNRNPQPPPQVAPTRPIYVAPVRVDEKEVIRDASRTDIWDDIVKRHEAKLTGDNRLRNLGPDRFWQMASQKIDLFGGLEFNPRNGQLIKNPAGLTEVRPLSKEEIRSFALFMLRLVSDKSMTLWADMVAREAREGVFVSMSRDQYASIISSGRYGTAISAAVGAKPNMLGWKRGLPIENQIETMLVGMVNWMTRSIAGGTKL